MATPYATSTGSIVQASAGQTVALECAITDIQLISDGTNAATLKVYDGTSASGVLIASLSIPATTLPAVVVPFNIPVTCNKGIFTVCTGSGASFVIHYVAV